MLEHDRIIVGCAALYAFPEERSGELACLAVHSHFRNAGAGEIMLREVEKRARKMKLKRIFVLTTSTSHWFIEHGFENAPVSVLPARKAALYNYRRKSRVMQKKLA